MTAGAVQPATAVTTWTWMAQSDWNKYDAWPSEEHRAERSRRKQTTMERNRQWRQANAEHLQALAEQRQRDAAHSAWLYSDERVAAAGAEHVTSWTSVARIERRKNDPAKAKKELAVDARRKRVRRIALDREDRDALRDFARSRDCGELCEPTPAGMREAAEDGTPRRAKEAGAKLRRLTDSFYSRLVSIAKCTPEEFAAVKVPSVFCPAKSQRALYRQWLNHHAVERPLQRYMNGLE